MFRAAREPGDLCSRLGIAASRKFGGAVQRNRAKRLIRTLFRTNKPSRALDLVLVPRRELLDASYPELEAEYRQLLDRPLTPGARRPPRPGRHPRV